jgi:aspartate aminotransferase
MLKLNRRVAAIKPSATLAADARAAELRAAGVDVVPLAAGEPDFDTPERIKEAARQAMAKGLTKYTPVSGTLELKEAIRAKLKRDNGLDYEIGEIMAAAGSKPAEYNVIGSLFDEGDEVIVPTPAWVSFVAMVQLSGAQPKFIQCPESDGFLLDPERLRRAIGPQTRGIILNSPANPTGAVYDGARLEALARVLMESPDVWVMSDDAYEHMSYNGRIPHIFSIEPRLKPRGVVFNTLSKTYAMTGWRIGFAAGPREVISAATRLQSQNSGNPNSIAQAAAIEALTGPQHEVKTMVAEFQARRDLVVERMRKLPGFSLPNLPQGAFYAFPSVGPLLKREYRGAVIGHGDRLAEIILDQAQVAVVGGNDFDAPGHVRVSYATSRENLTKAFDRLERFARELMG